MEASSAGWHAAGPGAAGGEADGLDDALVARAAAQVGGDGLADLLLARGRVLVQAFVRAPQDARRAEPALQALGLAEGLLQRVEAVAAAPALDRDDLGAVGAGGQHQA